jgi:hypothetical protein
MTHRLATAVPLMAMLSLLLSGCGDRPLFDSWPLTKGPPHGWTTTMPVGSVFTDGLEVLQLGGHEPAVITSISLVGNAGLQLVGASLATPERDVGSIQQLKGYPPRNPHIPRIIPAVGATITPRAQDHIGWELLLGIKVTREGYLSRDGIVIEYSVAGRDYRTFEPAQLAVCTSSDYYRGHRDCPFQWQKTRPEPSVSTDPSLSIAPP